jgi:hypothetical protein
VRGLGAPLAPEPFLDAIRNGQDMPVGGSVADDEEIGDVAQPPKIQYNEVFGLLVQGAFDALGDLGGELPGQCGSSFS